jgi:hypothetical protein
VASLDKFEGDVLEVLGVIVLIVIAVIVWKLYGAAQGLSSFGSLVQKIVDAIKSLFSGGSGADAHSKLGIGGDWVYAGTAAGNWGGGNIGVDNPNLDSYTIGADSLDLLPLTATPIDGGN